MRKLLLLGVVLLLAGGGVIAYGVIAQDKQNAADRVRWQETQEARKFSKFVEQVNDAKTKDDYKALEATIATLPKKQQEALAPHVKLKQAVLNFAEAEELLNRARGLQTSLTVPTPPPEKRQVGVDSMGNPVYAQDQPEPTKIHPTAMKLFNEAVPLYESSKREMDRLTEIKGNDAYNFRLNYVKGEVYHRYTQLFATQETARELFNQTVTFYKHALRYKPADTDTVINIELLIKDEQGMAGNAGQPQQQKSKLLNQAAGSGRSKGN